MRKLQSTIIILLALSYLGGLNLPECKRMALQNNQAHKSQQELTQAAAAQQKSAFTDFLPQLSASGGYLRTNKKFSYSTPDLALPVTDAQGNVIFVTDAEGNPVLDSNGEVIVENWAILPSQDLEFGEEEIYLASLNLTQPIFTGGKLLEKYKISKYSQEISAAQSDLSRQELLVKTEKYFWRVISLQSKVKLADQYKAAVDKHVADLRHYLDEGVITPNILLEAQVKQNEAELLQIKAQNGLQLATFALNQLLGRPLASDLKLSGNLDEITIKQSEGVVRPELEIMQNMVNISSSLKRVARSNYLPNIVLNASYNWLNPNPYNSLQEEFGSDWQVGIMAELKLFGWNKRGFQLAASEHQQRAAQHKLQETEELIALEQSKAQYSLQEAAKKVELTRKSVQQAAENMQAVEDKFQAGLAKSSEVLDAQALWQQAVAEEISAKTEYQIENIKSRKAAGIL
jgi:outer membrane protein TolC